MPRHNDLGAKAGLGTRRVKSSIYSYFNLRDAWNGFDLVELWINHVWINYSF